MHSRVLFSFSPPPMAAQAGATLSLFNRSFLILRLAVCVLGLLFQLKLTVPATSMFSGKTVVSSLAALPISLCLSFSPAALLPPL
jgi:hypothetical protein